jgi:hypothetical protein
MPANDTGLLIYFDEARRRDLIQERVGGGYEPFTDALNVHDWESGQQDIDRLLSLRRYSGFRLEGKAADILLQEREALGISLASFRAAINSSLIGIESRHSIRPIVTSGRQNWILWHNLRA